MTSKECRRTLPRLERALKTAEKRVYQLNRRIVVAGKVATAYGGGLKRAERAKRVGFALIKQADAANAKLSRAFHDLMNAKAACAARKAR